MSVQASLGGLPLGLLELVLGRGRIRAFRHGVWDGECLMVFFSGGGCKGRRNVGRKGEARRGPSHDYVSKGNLAISGESAEA